MLFRSAEGIDTSQESLALDDIAAVGPGGHFLAQKHTRQHIREIWIPELSHPRISGDDQPAGDIHQRARTKFERILAEHNPEPLEGTVRNALRAVLEAAEQELGR